MLTEMTPTHIVRLLVMGGESASTPRYFDVTGRSRGSGLSPAMRANLTTAAAKQPGRAVDLGWERPVGAVPCTSIAGDGTNLSRLAGVELLIERNRFTDLVYLM